MTIDYLRNALQELDIASAQRLGDGLPARKAAEMEFHDLERDPELPPDLHEKLHTNEKYYATVDTSRAYTIRWIQTRARGRVFLDFACGNGTNAILAAKAGAALAIGIDISRVAVELSRRNALAQGVADNTFFLQADCENTGIPENAIDAMICSGVLHHMDLNYAFPEIQRILKHGGVCLGVEALGHNPIINLYRRLTPTLRTEWESQHILKLHDLDLARRMFDVQDVRYWHLVSILATPFRSLPCFRSLLKVANTMDGVLLRYPYIRKMAWMFSFELVKPVSLEAGFTVGDSTHVALER